MTLHRHVRRGLPPLVLAALLALLVVAVPAFAGTAVAPGDHGVAVKRLQRALGLHPDGVYGDGTQRAVLRFQRRHRLTADGVVGPATWQLIRRSGAAASGRVRPRSAVRSLQQRLGVGADGLFGPGTLAAVKTFQRAHGLTPDGVVGPATWTALGLRGAHPVLKRARLHHGAVVTPGAGGLPATIVRAIAAADRIAGRPYRYGGGHGSFSDSGYDCSGSVSYVLHGAGLLSRAHDSGEFMSWGAAGPGRWITIYANPGHAYMTIRTSHGLMRYDTSGMDDGSRWDGTLRPTGGYVVRHPVGF